MVAAPNLPERISEDEYLVLDRESDVKYEFIGGELYDMSGASPNHNLITNSANAALYAQLRGRPCKVYPSDMKVHIPSSATYAYPDTVVVCGEPEYQDDMLLNPTVVVEVLSPSTEQKDRGIKFECYWTIPSLQAYILIAQDRPRVEMFTRQADDQWLLTVADSLDIPGIDCRLALADVYEQVGL